MKKIFSLSVLVFFICGMSSCNKESNATTIPATAKCKPITESSFYNARNVTYTYSYNTDGTLANISYPPSNMAVNYAATSLTNPANYTPGLTDSLNTGYNANIYTGLPTKATQFLTLDGITYRNSMIFNFSYDSKNRLVQVVEFTPNNATDYEYQVTIAYNDNDNVTALKYETIVGTYSLKTINATGYDDKPNPYAAIKNWQLFMHAAWNNYDPAPILVALSKNNPLGFNITGDGVNASTISRTMAYTYNENGFPIKRVNTNTNNSGSYSFDEIYTYQCE